LTTVAQPVAEHGRLAARLVLAVIAGDTSRCHEHVVLPTSLVVRDTTGPPS
jgi:DNA-binding LacI/PurR family transcriptional regulator